MGNTAYTYEEISRGELEQFLDDLQIKKSSSIPLYMSTIGNEIVYAVNTPVPRVWIYVYSSLRTGRSKVRDKGKDAIRTVLGWKERGREMVPLTKTTHTKRITTWKKNLEKKVAILRSRAQRLPKCPRCGRVMRVRKVRKTGKPFFGCVGYMHRKETKHRCTFSRDLTQSERLLYDDGGL